MSMQEDDTTRAIERATEPKSLKALRGITEGIRAVRTASGRGTPIADTVMHAVTRRRRSPRGFTRALLRSRG